MPARRLEPSHTHQNSHLDLPMNLVGSGKVGQYVGREIRVGGQWYKVVMG